MIKKYIGAGLVALGLVLSIGFAAPAQAASLTSQQISAIIGLLQSFGADQNVINNVSVALGGTSISTSSNSCPNLYRALARGSRGSDVISLQQFLIAQSLLNGDSATGFFGPATEGAVQRWQAQNGVDSIGIVGVKTRAAIAARCGVTTPPVVQSCPQYQIPICATGQHVQRGATSANGCQSATMCVNDVANSSSFTVSPTSGAAPLSVKFNAAVGATYFGGVQIDFGDGNIERIFKPENNYSGAASHVYVNSGTYVARLVGIGEGSSDTLDTKTISVALASVSCPIYNACPAGYSINTSIDANGCTIRQCVPPSTTASATIDQQVTNQKLDVQPGCHTFALQPCGFITVSGAATNANSLYVALVKDYYSGATDYDTLLNATKTLDSPPAQINTVSVSVGTWSTTFRNAAGAYRAYVFDTNSKKLLIQGTVAVD